jgi:high-affinity Fe2+/Pb2+ permease
LDSNKAVIYLIVGAIVLMAVVCVATNCFMTFGGKEPSQAFNLLTGGLVGSLTSMLVKTSPTQTATQVAVQQQPVVVPAEPEPKP